MADEPRPGAGHSLTIRLLVLVMTMVAMVQGLIFIPGLQRERWRWLHERLNDAQLVLLALSTEGGPQPALRQLSDADMMGELAPGHARLVLRPPPPPGTRVQSVDLDREGWLEGFGHALGALPPAHGERLDVVGTSAIGNRLELMVPKAPLATFLRSYTLRFALLSAGIGLSISALLFVALRAMLVHPLRRIARNIALFRLDPESGVPLDAAKVSRVQDDEIALMGHELSAMQAELRTALWRNARLAAIGTAVAKMSHDLRGIVSSALLVADRLTMSHDEQTRKAGEVIVRAVHRVTGLAQDTLDFVREGPPAPKREAAELRALVDEAAGALGDDARRCRLENEVPGQISASLDRTLILRVLANLVRNAAQAGAGRVVVRAGGEEMPPVLRVEDDGPGLPQPVLDRLFKPFVASSHAGGTGLGLAIARDLMRAHGGDLVLDHTGPGGTCFALHLVLPRRDG